MTSHLPYKINPSFFENLSKNEIKEIQNRNIEQEIRFENFNSKQEKANQKKKCHNGYLSSLYYLDYQLSKLFYRLNKFGILKNSLIIITSDHGEEILDHEFGDKKNKYCGVFHHKSPYNTLVKVPLLWSIGFPLWVST